MTNTKYPPIVSEIREMLRRHWSPLRIAHAMAMRLDDVNAVIYNIKHS